MKRLVSLLPIGGIIAFMAACKIAPGQTAVLQRVVLAAAAIAVAATLLLDRRKQASPVHKAMTGFLVFACLMLWLRPLGGGRLVSTYPASALYAALFIMAAGPALLGRELFTVYFARKTTPETVWKTDVFFRINRNMTWFWAGLFLLGFLSGLVPGVFGLHGPVPEILFEGLLPASLLLGLGIPLNKRYPEAYQRKLGLEPVENGIPADPAVDPLPTQQPHGEMLGQNLSPSNRKKEDAMSDSPTIVAVNGSPHAGIGNTSMMIEMLRPTLSESGFRLETIQLSEHDIEFCTGCGLCMEKGACWIHDDHRGIVEKLLSADGVVLASPVYFLHVTAQMKAFLDRSLAFGHKPRPSWKPGLAVSVSAGLGETDVARYLSFLLRVYGAFSVGTLTALSAGPGQFLGKEAVEARAHDLARDMVRAIKEKRRYPAADYDLRFYQFMGNLVKDHKDTVMKDDYAHWQEHGLFDGFEAYMQQRRTEVPIRAELREAWIKEMIARHKRKRRAPRDDAEAPRNVRGPRDARTCGELLKMMPQGFNPSAAPGLTAVYQYEVTGDEEFVAHIRIADGVCTYHDGPADAPDVVVKTPAAVWLAIAKGELDGQQAFLSGKYRVEGDLSLLMKLRSLFSRPE